MTIDRRQFERFDIFLIVEYSALNKTIEYSQGITENVSHEGFSLSSQSHYFEPEEILELRLKQPHSDLSLSVLGEIVWKREAWYKCVTGIKFKDINEDNKNKIAELLSVAESKNAKPNIYDKEDETAEMYKEGQEAATGPAVGSEKELLRETLNEDNKINFEENIESAILSPEDSLLTTSSRSGYIDKVINKIDSINRIETTKTDNAQVRDKNLKEIQDKRLSLDSETGSSGKTLTGAKNQRKKSRLYILLAVVFAAVSIIALSGKFENIKQGLINLTSTKRQLVTIVDDISPESITSKEFIGQMQGHKSFEIKNKLPEEEKTPGSEQTLMTSGTDQDTDNKQPLVAVDNTLSKNMTEQELPESGRHKLALNKTREFPEGEQIINIKQHVYQETDKKSQAYVDEDSQAETVISNELPGPPQPRAIKRIDNYLTVQEGKPDLTSTDKEDLLNNILTIKKSIETSHQKSIPKKESIPLENDEVAYIKQQLPELKEAKEISGENIKTAVIPDSVAEELAETFLIEEKKEIIQETAGVKGVEDFETDEKSADSSEALIDKEAIVKRVIPKKTEREEAIKNIPEIKKEFVESSAIPAEETPEKVGIRSGIGMALFIKKTEKQTALTDELEENKKETVAQKMESRIEVPDESGEIRKETVTFFEEHFDKKSNEWDIFSSSVASAQIKGGKYLIENKRKKGSHFVFYRHDFTHEKDFEIEVYLKAAKTIYSHSYGFVLGAKDAYNNLIFKIINNQYYLINKYNNGIQKDLNGGKLEERIINKEAFNAVKIEKKGRIMRFYINDNFIHEISDISFEGNRIGFVVEGELKISVDRIRSRIISYQ